MEPLLLVTDSQESLEWISRGEVELSVDSNLLGVPAIDAFISSINGSFKQRNSPLAKVIETVPVKPDGPLAWGLADGGNVPVDPPAKRQICPTFSMPRFSQESAMIVQAAVIRDKIIAAAARHEFAAVYRALQNTLHGSQDAAAGDAPDREAPQPWTIDKFRRAAKSLSDTEGPLVILASADTVHGLWANNHPRSDGFKFLAPVVTDRGLNSVTDKAGNLWVIVGQMPDSLSGLNQGIATNECKYHLGYEEFVFDPNSIVVTTPLFFGKLTIRIEADTMEPLIRFFTDMTVGATVIDPSGVHRVINKIPKMSDRSPT